MGPAKTALIRVASTSVRMGSNPERLVTEPHRTAPDPTLLVLLGQNEEDYAATRRAARSMR